ncbi:uncharacterized protein Z519_00313 [Cladophialophora bantiana CBS 173.52]|uniref:Uncharacterized protein n=1 Tax=Cladophialophora bantiana (strain ATCC 10958 / CBS 173.52 / CDC B-1940 / NIH 8579) TaxID=1442370 RepID=A0A0D2GJR2_CLAB1|nr:uncharacterized protein Z519_00313 [Cladophialophora bantiana CBS 173.52]KIW98652.1 hypothetical protein Z519_00313 [Cladophialophora bantiana CBS 173.52]
MEAIAEIGVPAETEDIGRSVDIGAAEVSSLGEHVTETDLLEHRLESVWASAALTRAAAMAKLLMFEDEGILTRG